MITIPSGHFTECKYFHKSLNSQKPLYPCDIQLKPVPYKKVTSRLITKLLKDIYCSNDAMIFRNEHKRSYLPKVFIVLALFGSICISGYLMFFEESEMNPLKENYLKDKYGKEFDAYAANTKKLVPLIY